MSPKGSTSNSERAYGARVWHIAYGIWSDSDFRSDDKRYAISHRRHRGVLAAMAYLIVILQLSRRHRRATGEP